MKKSYIHISLILLLTACTNTISVIEDSFGQLSSGEETHLITITNSSGSSIKLCDYGARVVSINVPDKNGKIDDVVVGPGDIETFEMKDRFMGSVIGRYGNRINTSSFSIDSVKYNLVPNEHIEGVDVQCHGGPNGFDRFIWKYEIVKEESRVGVIFSRLSPDGEQGYPGNCGCIVKYWWGDDNILKIEYEAVSDKATVINLSNHTFFNLKGREGGYVMDHRLEVASDLYVQNNVQMCPDKILSVENSPFDFRAPQRVDYRLDMPNEHLRIMKGMSACWIIRNWNGNLNYAAKLTEPRSGRMVEVYTTEPCLLTFTGRTFDGSLKGKYKPIEKYEGMLLETIHAADSPNQPRFPSTVLHPGEKYYSSTEFRFGVIR